MDPLIRHTPSLCDAIDVACFPVPPLSLLTSWPNCIRLERWPSVNRFLIVFFLIWMEWLSKTFITFFPAFTLFFAFLLLIGFCYLIIMTIKINLCNKQQIWNSKYQLLKQDQNFLIRLCYLWLHLIEMMIPILRAVAWLPTRNTHACVWEKKKTHHQKWPVCFLLSRLVWRFFFSLSDSI